MVASTDIKWFTSDNLNAPQLTNDWGVLIGVLDACLINGLSVQSIASLTASGTTVTATFNTAHQYKQYQVIEITGAAQAEYNVQARILTVPNANSITFELASAPSVTTATGTITCKLPAMDWEKAFSGTQKAAYRSKNIVLASRPFLRVDNSLDPVWTTTYSKYAKVGIVESMSDIDTMSGVQAPYDAAAPTKNWVGTGTGTAAINGWAKWLYGHNATVVSSNNKTSSTTGTRSWVVIGNGDTFYLLNYFVPTDNKYLIYSFGSFDSLLPTDSSNTLLSATIDYTSAATAVSAYANSVFSQTAATGLLLQRKYDQATSYGTAKSIPLFLNGTAGVLSGTTNYIAAPSVAGQIIHSDMFIVEDATPPILRGKPKLIRFLYQQRPYSNLSPFVESGEIFLPVYVASQAQDGQVIFKIGVL